MEKTKQNRFRFSLLTLLIFCGWVTSVIAIPLRWDQWKTFQTLRGHTDEIDSTRISYDNRILASSSTDKTFRIWDLSSGKLLKTVLDKRWNKKRIFFSYDYSLLCAWGYRNDYYLKFIRTFANDEKVHKIQFSLPIYDCRFSQDNQAFAIILQDKSIHVYDIQTLNKLPNLDTDIMKWCGWEFGMVKPGIKCIWKGKSPHFIPETRALRSGDDIIVQKEGYPYFWDDPFYRAETWLFLITTAALIIQAVRSFTWPWKWEEDPDTPELNKKFFS